MWYVIVSDSNGNEVKLKRCETKEEALEVLKGFIDKDMGTFYTIRNDSKSSKKYYEYE